MSTEELTQAYNDMLTPINEKYQYTLDKIDEYKKQLEELYNKLASYIESGMTWLIQKVNYEIARVAAKIKDLTDKVAVWIKKQMEVIKNWLQTQIDRAKAFAESLISAALDLETKMLEKIAEKKAAAIVKLNSKE